MEVFRRFRWESIGEKCIKIFPRAPPVRCVEEIILIGSVIAEIIKALEVCCSITIFNFLRQERTL